MIRLIGFMGLMLQLMLFPMLAGDRNIRPDAKEIDNRFSQVWKESEASRKVYTWKTVTEVIRDDKTIQTLVEKVTYDQNGKETRQVISNKEDPLPTGFMVGRIAADQKAKIVEFMKELRTFLEKYALTDDNKRHAFFNKATISDIDPKGQVQVAGSDVFAQGDNLKWWINTKSYSLTYATISTTFRGVAVQFSAAYGLLPGLNYMAQATIRVPGKDMVIKLKFYDFVKA